MGETPESDGDGEEGDEDEDNVDPLHADTLEEYYGKREFVFIHHFAGPNDPLTAEVRAEAEKEGLKIKCISCEKATGTGNLLDDEPYATHLRWALKGYVDAYHSGYPCSTFSKLRFRPAEGLPGPVRTTQEPYGRRREHPSSAARM